MLRVFWIAGMALALFTQSAVARKQDSTPLTLDAINAAQWAPATANKAPKKSSQPKTLNPLVAKAQVLLARAGFSPGVIDARGGENFEKALRGFQPPNSLPTTAELDEASWTKLSETSQDAAATRYTISAQDVKGPFVERIPKDFRKMGEHDPLGSTGT